MVNHMIYNDGKYHVEEINGPWVRGFALVTTFGEICEDDDGECIFKDKEFAQGKCDALNICPDGGVIRNLR